VYVELAALSVELFSSKLQLKHVDAAKVYADMLVVPEGRFVEFH
jgi:hypothetical protein